MKPSVLHEAAELLGCTFQHSISILLVLADEILLRILPWRWQGLPLDLVDHFSREGLPRERPLVVVAMSWHTYFTPVLLYAVLEAWHPLLILNYPRNVMFLVSVRCAQWRFLDFVEGRGLLAVIIMCQPKIRISPGELVLEARFVDVLGLEAGLPNDTGNL